MSVKPALSAGAYVTKVGSGLPQLGCGATGALRLSSPLVVKSVQPDFVVPLGVLSSSVMVPQNEA